MRLARACLFLVAVQQMLFAQELIAGEGVDLEVVVASYAKTQILRIHQSDDKVTWSLFLDQDREIISADVETVGQLSVEKNFARVLQHQTSDSQRKRIENAGPYDATFVLLFREKDRIQISRPMTNEEHRAFLSTELLQIVLKDLKSRRILLKPDDMFDFVYPGGRGQQGPPKPRKE